MIDFKSHSQFAQDRFPYEIIAKPEQRLNGTFIDIGCNDPINNNNSYALEKIGWVGVLSDVIPNCVISSQVRKSKFILGDAAKIDWRHEISELKPDGVIDYLSLDVDDNGFEVLQAIMVDGVRFRTATIEHDAYRIGVDMRDRMRSLLRRNGYELICSNVCWNGNQPLEDWWAFPSLVDYKVVAKLRCESKEWSDIFSRD